MNYDTSSPEDTDGLLRRLKEYPGDKHLSNRELTERLGVPYSTLTGWRFFTEREEPRTPSETNLKKIKDFLQSKDQPEVYAGIHEARHRTEKVKYLLLMLEDELQWFRDSGLTARNEFRQQLDASDIGYISSLLTMLTDEDKFNRWSTLTTTRFQFFRGK